MRSYYLYYYQFTDKAQGYDIRQLKKKLLNKRKKEKKEKELHYIILRPSDRSIIIEFD